MSRLLLRKRKLSNLRRHPKRINDGKKQQEGVQLRFRRHPKRINDEKKGGNNIAEGKKEDRGEQLQFRVEGEGKKKDGSNTYSENLLVMCDIADGKKEEKDGQLQYVIEGEEKAYEEEEYVNEDYEEKDEDKEDNDEDYEEEEEDDDDDDDDDDDYEEEEVEEEKEDIHKLGCDDEDSYELGEDCSNVDFIDPDDDNLRHNDDIHEKNVDDDDSNDEEEDDQNEDDSDDSDYIDDYDNDDDDCDDKKRHRRRQVNFVVPNADKFIRELEKMKLRKHLRKVREGCEKHSPQDANAITSGTATFIAFVYNDNFSSVGIDGAIVEKIVQYTLSNEGCRNLFKFLELLDVSYAASKHYLNYSCMHIAHIYLFRHRSTLHSLY